MAQTTPRVAVVFDHATRPETTGTYVRRALGELTAVEHLLPRELPHYARDGIDFFLHVDDGHNYTLPEALRPTALWAIDTHLNFDWFRQISHGYNFVFTAQRDGMEQLRAHGLTNATWLPLACDPEIHARQDVPLRYDLCFVGNLFPGPRAELLALLQRHFANMFTGQRYFTEMARTYSESRIVFNRSIKNDLNMRVFEALCAGSLLLTNDLGGNGLEELFQDGVHLATYRDEDELLDKARFYLRREDIRAKVAAAGRAEVLAKHTYRQRMAKLLETARTRGTQTSVPSSVKPTATVPPPAPNTPSFTANPDYYGCLRPELLEAIPATARRVLDLGCGSGRLGAALKSRQAAQVTGIELDTAAAACARTVLDGVHEGDIERLDVDFAATPFDAIVCGDVLEHLRDPLAVLKRLRTWLAPQGRLVVSIPNVRHHSVIRALLAGHWTYEPAGLLDHTHLRFFTRRELEKLLFRAGFALQELHVLGQADHHAWTTQGRPGEVRVGSLHIGGLPAAEAEEFYAYQFLALAAPAPPPPVGLTSIILVTLNQLDYTRQCLDSLKLLTDEPYELIVVDNASTDGTRAWLRARGDVRLIENDTNRGFPAAVNQGLQSARGQYLLLLNNDTLVTSGWLRRLLRVLQQDARIGLVGPCSNCVSGEQQVPITYQELNELDGFAWDFGQTYNGQVEDTDRLVGFCLLFTRAVLDKVGLLDERFGLGCYEDDDFTKRALAAGYRAVIARDAFLHHYGGRTFVGSGVDFATLMAENQRKFQEKWQTPPTTSVTSSPPLPEVLTVKPRPVSPVAVVHKVPGSVSPQPHQSVRLSLCMIVRNNEKILDACLRSIAPWVDEMVIVDTGSTDRTSEVAARFGAKVVSFPWIDDFAAARNESFRHARGAWIFWMDSDDTISPEHGRQLRALALGTHPPEVLGYICQVHCPGAGPKGHLQTVVVDHVKLVRNRPDVRFEFRIHENILPSIRRAGGEVMKTNIFVTHTGYDHSPEGQKRKVERDLKLLHLELRDRPEHPFPLFNLGMTYNSIGEYAEAITYLERYLAKAEPSETPLRKAYAFLVGAHDRLGQRAQAWRRCIEGLSRFSQDNELRYLKAQLFSTEQRWTEASATLDDLLAHQEPNDFASLDPGITGYRARHLSAVAAREMGQLTKAESAWRQVVTEMPDFAEGWRGLGSLYLKAQRYADVERLVTELTTRPDLRAEGLMLQGLLAAARHQTDAAQELFLQAAEQGWTDPEVLNLICQHLFEHVDIGTAYPLLERLRELTPNDPGVWHHLGVVYLHAQRFSEAGLVLEEALRLRPGHPPTRELLAHAHQAGRTTQRT